MAGAVSSRNGPCTNLHHAVYEALQEVHADTNALVVVQAHAFGHGAVKAVDVSCALQGVRLRDDCDNRLVDAMVFSQYSQSGIPSSSLSRKRPFTCQSHH